MAPNAPNPRHQPCYILRTHGIPSVVWFEDAVGYYGVPTVVFDLYVLVPDIDSAAQILVHHGWNLIPQQHGRIGNVTVDIAQRRLASPSNRAAINRPEAQLRASEQSQRNAPGVPRHTNTVLLPAADWKFKLEESETAKSSPKSLFPPLAGLLDALIESALDCSPDNANLAGHIDLHIAYLYGRVPEVKERAFAESLKYEHRQYHLDVLSGMTTGTVPFNKHQRRIRQALRQRTYTLQECSASREDETLFDDGVRARLLASLPDPFS